MKVRGSDKNEGKNHAVSQAWQLSRTGSHIESAKGDKGDGLDSYNNVVCWRVVGYGVYNGGGAITKKRKKKGRGPCQRP